MSAALAQILRTPAIRRYDPGQLAAFLTRASAAWGIDPATGLLRQYATNEARLVLSPAGVLSILREPQSTNLALRANDIASSAWTVSTTTKTANQTGVDGTVNGAVTVEATAAVYASIFQIMAATAGTAYTGWWLVKAGTATTCQIEMRYNAGDDATQDALLTLTGAGAVTAVQAGTTGYCYLIPGTSWYLVGASKVATTGATSCVAILQPGGASLGAVSAAGNNIIVGFGQFEATVGPTSPIVTAGSTVTRSRDEIVIPTAVAAGAPFSEVLDFCLPWSATSHRLIGSQNGTRDVYCNALPSTVGSFNGSGTVDTANTFAANTRARVSHGCNGDGIAVCLNGGAVASGNSTMGSITARVLGQEAVGSGDTNAPVCYIHEYRQARRRLSHGELQWHTTA